MLKKYFAIIDRKTGYVFLLSMAITYFCYRFDFSFNLNVTLFSIAVVFPLVFTIREAFRKRTAILKFLSMFKASLNATYYCFANNNKLTEENKQFVANSLHAISDLFFDALRGKEYQQGKVRDKLNEVYEFINNNRDVISTGVALKIIRFLKDVNESIENTVGLKLHGTPISLRAYCLVFIYVFPFVFIPTLINDMGGNDQWIVYALGAVHGFILISLYNVQDDMEDPFDQVGLDDIKLEEFHFAKEDSFLEKPAP
ncbi:MAG: hypothetical protein GKR91_03910 [Pseudomonadales bacterium]|nr:hypothetical protein [Pseudomonadales bacterium]